MLYDCDTDSYGTPVRLSDLSDHQLFQSTRIDRDMFNDLVALLGDQLSRPTTRGHAVPVDTQLLCALQFYATGSFQWTIARNCGISQSSASRAIDDVTNSLVAIAPKTIAFPRDQRSLTAVKQEFQKLAGFPNVVGAIDGTHIAIRSPPTNEDAFVNRKGVHTINVQVQQC